MTRAIGCDLIEIERIRKSLKRPGFIERVFTEKEQAYCNRYQDPAPHFAGRFAAKEALAKALGSGIGKQLSWLDLEILPDSLGKPHVFYTEKVRQRFSSPSLFITMTHTKDLAQAFALWE